MRSGHGGALRARSGGSRPWAGECSLRVSLLLCVLAPGLAACVDVTSQAGPSPGGGAKGEAAEAGVLPTGERFPGCPAGTVARGFPVVRDAIAAYCVTAVEPARRQGPFVSFYPNGKTLAKGWYEAGNPDGPWVTYHENGQKLSEGAYVRGVRDGAWVFSREDGGPLLEEVLSGGARVSWKESSYDERGLQQVESFVTGAGGRPVSHGPALRVDGLGDVLSGRYAQGKADGVWEEKTAKGIVVLRVEMKAGFGEGKFEAFWPETGKPSATGELLKTLPQGAWTLSFPGGEKRAELRFEKGLLRSLKVFHPNGQERLSGELQDGAPHAVWTARHPDGTLHVSGVYSKGVRQGMWRTADETGKTLAEGRYEDGVLIDGQPVEPLVWASLGLGESLQGLFADLAWMTTGRGRIESEQRSIAECLLFGDPAERCLVLDWENFRRLHAEDGPAEIDRRTRQQDLACAMNNPAACARVGKRLAGEAGAGGAAPAGAGKGAGGDRKKVLSAVAGFYQKACDLAPIEVAWRARSSAQSKMYKELYSASACLWLGRMLEAGEVKSKAQSPRDLYRRACDMEIAEGCTALSEALKKEAPKKVGKGP